MSWQPQVPFLIKTLEFTFDNTPTLKCGDFDVDEMILPPRYATWDIFERPIDGTSERIKAQKLSKGFRSTFIEFQFFL